MKLYTISFSSRKVILKKILNFQKNCNKFYLEKMRKIKFIIIIMDGIDKYLAGLTTTA